LELLPKKKEAQRFVKRRGAVEAPPPDRGSRMKPDQTWGDVWPAPRTFHPAVVPLPVRQGVKQTKAHVIPSKWANTELMKIPNFLHLTPPVVSRHCAALAKFCTPWPKGLETDEDIDRHFPLTVVTGDYLHSSSSIRDRRARIVTTKFHVDSLPLDAHAKDKFLRLVGHRYDEESGIVTLTCDRCPYRGQNMDYTVYLLTALYHESWSLETWEKKEASDQEQATPTDCGEEGEEESGSRSRAALRHILNRGEDEASVASYREEVRALLGLPPPPARAEVVN